MGPFSLFVSEIIKMNKIYQLVGCLLVILLIFAPTGKATACTSQENGMCQHGTCTGGPYSCACVAAWYGANCNRHRCNEHGHYNGIGAGTCTCDSGYDGSMCENTCTTCGASSLAFSITMAAGLYFIL